MGAGVLGTAGVAYAGNYPGDDNGSSHSSRHHHCGCKDDHDGHHRDGDNRDRDRRDGDCRDGNDRGLLGELLGAL